jgi:DNA-binding MarR family transcriptional regulator
MLASADECAKEVLDVVPLIMRTIRVEMRHRRTADLRVPHFRTLLFLSRQPGASLSEVAEFLGLTLPSTSTMVDGMVARSLVARQTSSADRRRIILTLTASGQAILEAARSGTQSRLAEILAVLSPAECRVVIQALQALRPIFTPGEDWEGEASR